MPAYTNATQVIPDLFKQIMVNHAELEAEVSKPVISFKDAGRLVRIKRDYRRAAEIALAWNTNKGNTSGAG